MVFQPGFNGQNPLVGLGLLWLTLFGRELWLKWTCLGCTGLGALLMGGSLLAGGVAGSMFGEAYSSASSFVQLLINLWFLSILWRDIQQLNNGGY